MRASRKSSTMTCCSPTAVAIFALRLLFSACTSSACLFMNALSRGVRKESHLSGANGIKMKMKGAASRKRIPSRMNTPLHAMGLPLTIYSTNAASGPPITNPGGRGHHIHHIFFVFSLSVVSDHSPPSYAEMEGMV